MTNEEKLKLCPTVTLKGWWWKQYFPHYKNMVKIANEVIKRDWLNGGYEAHIENTMEYILTGNFIAKIK